MKKESMTEHFKSRFSEEKNIYTVTPPIPSSLNIELNNTCNQKCFFCPYHGDYAKHKISPALMTIDFAKILLKKAWEAGIGKKELGLYLAGEPLLYNGLEEVIQYAKKLGFSYIFLTSNGAFASLERMKLLIDAGLNSIRFSVNAADKETYKRYHGTDSFDVVKNNILSVGNYVQKNNIELSISISCVITKETNGIQNDVREIFGEYVDEIIFLPVYLGRSVYDENLNKRYAMTDYFNSIVDGSYICPILFNTMYINARGEAVPCCEAYDSECSFAKLDESSNLEEIWNSKIYQRYRNIFIGEESDEGTICKNCLLRRKGIEGELMA